MNVTRVETDSVSRVEPPFDNAWDDLTKLEWQAAVASLDTGLLVTVTVANTGSWRTVKRFFNVGCGSSSSSSSSGPYDYREALMVLIGISIGAGCEAAAVTRTVDTA